MKKYYAPNALTSVKKNMQTIMTLAIGSGAMSGCSRCKY